MAWTEKQEDAIKSRHESLLVSAAAGSGKTSVLVERVTGLLKEGYDLSRMLIVTFTNAAAAEMKERIALSLGYGAVRHSHISTFHKFAIDVIRKYYHVININPSFSICDEYNQSVMKNDAMDEMFEDLFNDENEDFQDFLNHYCTAKSNANAKALIQELHTFIQSLPDSESFLRSIEDGKAIDIDSFIEFSEKTLGEELNKAAHYCDALIEMLENPLADGVIPMIKLSEKVKADKSGIEEIISLLDRHDFEAAIRMLSEFSFVRFVKSKDEKSSYEQIADQADGIRDRIKDIVSAAKDSFSGLGAEKLSLEIQLTKKPLSQLVFLCREFDRRYSKKKKDKGLLDFSDIEHFALKILENKTVCDEIRDSFDCIFVDEYQDSNLVQDELINRIAKEDNVFLVGDVKQSIYKFRLAEPELFISRYDRYKNHQVSKSRCIDLSNNFRSKASVIDFINRTFEILMNKQTVGISYDNDARLYEGNPYTGDISYSPRLFLISKNDDEELPDSEIEDLKAAELEALNAARIIKEYYGKTIYDSKKKFERKLDYSDMVILLRSAKGRGELYYQALENSNIPVYIERNEGYFDTPEIQFFLNLLRIIDNFRQDVPLISVLHFPSFGFTAEELAYIRIFAKEEGKAKLPFSSAFKYYAVCGSNEKLKEKARSFLDRIELWRKKSSLMPLADFVWELMSEIDLDIFAKALPSGSQRYANLRVLADKAQSYEEQNAGGLFGFISYIDAAGEKGKSIETGQVSMLGEGANAVRIMTIHKSKGLEFPFVLLCGLGSVFMSSKNKLHLGLHKDFGASIRITDPKKDIYSDPCGLEIINLKKKKEELAETIRVLYVAMTRAKDILLMSSVCRDAASVLKMNRKLLAEDPAGAKNYLEMILPAIPPECIEYVSKKDLALHYEKEESESSFILDSLNTGFAVDKEKLPVSCEEIAERLNFDYHPKEEELQKSKYSVSEIAALTREEEKINKLREYNVSGKAPKFIRDIPVDAASIGTAYHTVMEHIHFDAADKSADAIASLIVQLKDRNILDEAAAKLVDPEKIAAFFVSDIGRRASLAKEVYKESPFVLKSKFKGREVFVQGTIDCYFEENGEYVLIDYKSNYIDERKTEAEKKRLREEYLPQLMLYKEALEKINHIRVKEAVVYLFGINDTITI